MKKKYNSSDKKFKGLKNKPYKKHSQNKKSSVKSLNKKKSTKKLTKKQKNKQFSVAGIPHVLRKPSKKDIRKAKSSDYPLDRNKYALDQPAPVNIYNAEFPSEAFNFSGDTYSRILKLKAIRSITGRY